MRRIFRVLKKINFLIEKSPMVLNRQFTEEETHEKHCFISNQRKEISNRKIGFNSLDCEQFKNLVIVLAMRWGQTLLTLPGGHSGLATLEENLEIVF